MLAMQVWLAAPSCTKHCITLHFGEKADYDVDQLPLRTDAMQKEYARTNCPIMILCVSN